MISQKEIYMPSLTRATFLYFLLSVVDIGGALAQSSLGIRAANAIAISNCNTIERKYTVDQSNKDLKKQFKLAGISGSKELEKIIIMKSSLGMDDARPLFVSSVVKSMQQECPQTVSKKGVEETRELVKGGIEMDSLLGLIDLSKPTFVPDKSNIQVRLPPKKRPSNTSSGQKPSNQDIHDLCKDVRDYEGCVKVKSDNSSALLRKDRWGLPAPGLNFIKFVSKDRDFYVHKTSAKSYKVRGKYGRYVGVNLLTRGIGDNGFREIWVTARYDCEDDTNSNKLNGGSGYAGDWKKVDNWYTRWIKKHLCITPKGFTKATLN